MDETSAINKNMIRELIITPVLNGFVVRVGCQQLVYVDREKLVRDLNEYQAPQGDGNTYHTRRMLQQGAVA